MRKVSLYYVSGFSIVVNPNIILTKIHQVSWWVISL